MTKEQTMSNASIVTEEQKQIYRDVGTVRIPNAIGAEAVASLTRLIDDTIARMRDGTMPRAVLDDPVFSDIEMEDHDGYTRLINMMPQVPAAREWLLQSGLPDIVADVIGANNLRIWLDGTFSKEGSANETATPWHTDESTFSLQGEHLPSLWIGLTDVDEGNAPLITLAGSHKDRSRYHSPYSPQDVEVPPEFRPWSDLVDQATAPDADLRIWTTNAGDVLLIHPRTIHASLPRTAADGGRRLAFTVRWIGNDVVWMPTPVTMTAPFDTHPLMEVGKAPPEDIFPVVWHREREKAPLAD